MPIHSSNEMARRNLFISKRERKKNHCLYLGFREKNQSLLLNMNFDHSKFMFCSLLGFGFKWILLTDPEKAKVRKRFNWSWIDRESGQLWEAKCNLLRGAFFQIRPGSKSITQTSSEHEHSIRHHSM